MQITVKWRDERVRFQQLGEETELKNVTLWKPIFQLDGSVFKDYRAYSLGENVIESFYALKDVPGPYISYRGYEGNNPF